MLATMAAASGCRLSPGDANEPRRAQASKPFDLILMDVQLPLMDGLQATAAIREEERGTGRHVPIAAMTAHAMQGDRERTLQAGMDDHLTKPLRTNELLEAVVRLGRGVGPGELAGNRASVWNREEALQRLDQDEGLLLEVCKLLLREAPGIMRRITEAVRGGDTVRAAEAVHSLKSSVGSVGARAAFSAAQQLEQTALQGDLDSVVKSQLPTLVEEMDRLTDALHDALHDP